METALAHYAITEGGPLRRVERALRLVRGDERDWLRCAGAFLLVVYVPVVLFGVGWRVVEGEWLPALLRIDAHARALAAVPLLLAAEPFVEARALVAGQYLSASGLLSSSRDEYRDVVARTSRLRDSSVVEIGLFAAAITLSGAAFVGGVSAFALASVPAVVVMRFLLLRWIWRWVLWCLFVYRLSRLPLALRATHPDRMAGLAPLVGPAHVFCLVVAAAACVLAGGWADLMTQGHRTLASVRDVALTYWAIAAVVTILPGASLVPALYRARRDGLASYGAFARRYAEAYETRWFSADGEQALGTPDISGMCDIDASYDVLGEIRVLRWTLRLLVLAAIAVAVPMLPLVLVEIGFPALVQHLLEYL